MREKSRAHTNTHKHTLTLKLKHISEIIHVLHSLQAEDCSIGEEGCAALISALRSNPSHLTELDDEIIPGDSGVKLLSALLEDPHCKLKKLL